MLNLIAFTSSNCLPFSVFWILGKRKSHIEPCLQSTGGDMFGMWYFAKIAAHVGPSALVHRVTLAIHKTALFLVVYGELHCGRNLAVLHKNASVKFGLDFLHGAQYLADWKSNKHCFFFLSSNSIFMLLSSFAHSSKSESVYRECFCHSDVRSCGTYFAGTSCAWHEPKEFPSSATSLMICLWSVITISCTLLPFRKDTRYLLWLCAYRL